MKGNTLTEFLDDLLASGGPEKEFIFRDKTFFLEAIYSEMKKKHGLRLDEYVQERNGELRLEKSSEFWGDSFIECTEKFENAPLFDGMSICDAEAEIEVTYG